MRALLAAGWVQLRVAARPHSLCGWPHGAFGSVLQGQDSRMVAGGVPRAALHSARVRSACERGRGPCVAARCLLDCIHSSRSAVVMRDCGAGRGWLDGGSLDMLVCAQAREHPVSSLCAQQVVLRCCSGVRSLDVTTIRRPSSC